MIRSSQLVGAESFGGLEFYALEVHTGNARFARPKSPVYITLASPTLQTERIHLTTFETAKKTFQKNKVDVFLIVAPRLDSKLTQIILECEDRWYLEEIAIKVNGFTYYACFQNWLQGQQVIDVLVVEERWSKYYGGRLVFGPMLRYRGLGKLTKGNEFRQLWKVSAMIVTENVETITEPLTFISDIDEIPRKSAAPFSFYQNGAYRMWRFDFDIPVHPTIQQVINYSIPGGKPITFYVPAGVEKPRIIFGSCLDRAEPYGMVNLTEKAIGWDYLYVEHLANKYQVLVFGGDQVYADQVFCGCKHILDWYKLNHKEVRSPKWEAFFSDEMALEADCFYFWLYISTWSQEMFAKILSCVPTFMIWDDHDIFDGWGSRNPEFLNCEVPQGIFRAAQKHFFLFQQFGDTYSLINDVSPQGPYNSGYLMTGGVAFLMPDTRSERTMITHDQGIIMSEKTWRDIENWLALLATEFPIRHLFVEPTTPIIYPHSSYVDKVFDLLNHELIDDCRDHWPAVIHKEESRRLIANLDAFRLATGSQVTILSGDVHCACYAVIRDTNTGEVIMEQLISSGVASEPPPPLGRLAMERLFKKKFFLPPNFSLQMGRLPNGKMLDPRDNFMCLLPIAPRGEGELSYVAKWVSVPTHKEPLIRHALPPPGTQSHLLL